MSVRFRKERGRWMIDLCLEVPGRGIVRVRELSPINTQKAAKEHERRLIESLLSSSASEKKGVSFEEFAVKFMESYAAANNKFSEVETKRSILQHHLLPAFGDGPIDPGDEAIEMYKAEKLAAGLSRKTVNNHLACLSRMLTIAKKWKYVATPTVVERLKLEPVKFDFLDFAEADRLLEGAKGEGRTMILLALRTGLRFGELLALRWEDLDLVVGRLVVRQSWWRGKVGSPKSGRHREVPLTPQVIAALKEHRHLRGEQVFCREDGSIMSRTIAWRIMRRACKRAGLRQVGWHVLRHTFASHLVMRGVPLKVVQEFLGHASVTMTMRYSHLAPAIKRDAILVLDGAAPQADAKSEKNVVEISEAKVAKLEVVA